MLPATGARRNDGLGEEGAPHKGGHGACALALALAFVSSEIYFSLCLEHRSYTRSSRSEDPSHTLSVQEGGDSGHSCPRLPANVTIIYLYELQ